jgi:hypothetical protein
MPPDTPRYEYRAWAQAFPQLPQPEGEPWSEETYLVVLGLVSLNIKLRQDRLEIKQLKLETEGLQLWQSSARLPLPVPALVLERELMTLLQSGQPLHREHYDAAAILVDVVEARRNVAAISLRKRRRLLDAAGCRGEITEVEFPDGSRGMTAAVEDGVAANAQAAVRAMRLGDLPNLPYPRVLEPLARRQLGT